MKNLIIIAHPKKNSFNFAVLERLMESLKKKGHEIQVRDLYDKGFSPVLTDLDLQQIYSGNAVSDIKTEQDFINWADVIHIIYPVWWVGFPAILKGYIDRVFHYGFAYSFDKTGLVKHLTGKKGFLYSSHGMPKQVYEGEIYKALKITSDTGVFEFCGMEVVHHEFFPSAVSADKETIAGYLDRVSEITEQML